MKVVIVTSFSVLLLDQLTKYFLKNQNFVVTNFFKISYVENTGASFGMLKGFNWLFIIVAFIAIFYVFKYYNEVKKEKFYVHLAVGFLLGGIIGNLIDRVFLGYVRDFISFSFWPTFNFADTFSTIAVILLIAHILFKK
ncbi:MAG: signal peptidase II [Nanoarchaeota archaeon]|nr:signal peptidase II [Nanoarchaeota archaeon]